MRFTQPTYLYVTLGLVIALFLFYVLVSKLKKKAKQKLGDLELIDKLSVSFSPKKARWKKVLILLTIIFLGLTLARPQIGKKDVMVKRKGVDIVVCLDLSLSMLSEDLKPNRLEKAKMELANLFSRMEGDRVGIVVFAGEAYVECPLTLDLSAAQMFLDAANVGLVPKPGTAIADAIDKGLELFDKREKKYKVMILLTDGEDHGSEPVEAAKRAKEEGVIIYTIGIGSTQGEPIPLTDKGGSRVGYKEDEKGEMVLSRLNPQTLREIAENTGGKYFIASAGEMEIERMYEEISHMEKKELQDKLFTLYQDKYQYFLVFSLLFLVIESFISERRRG
ncbi:MAG TPA: VWA domain-containing protein [candidate division Zixibacteria bacterium]